MTQIRYVPQVPRTLGEALRVTAKRITSGSRYKWTHMGACNCGHLAQTVTFNSPEALHKIALQRAGDWAEQTREYCPTSGYPLDFVISALLDLGATLQELRDLERLSDPKRALAVLMTVEAGGDIDVLRARANLQRRMSLHAPLEKTLTALASAENEPMAVARIQSERGDLLRFELNRSDLAIDAYGAAVVVGRRRVRTARPRPARRLRVQPAAGRAGEPRRRGGDRARARARGGHQRGATRARRRRAHRAALDALLP